MEGIDTNVSPASHAQELSLPPPVRQGIRAIRFGSNLRHEHATTEAARRIDELENALRCERAAKEAALHMAQEVIKCSAIISSSPSIDSGRGVSETEIIREVQQLRQLLKESQEENSRLKEKFRVATYMRAHEIAQTYAKSKILPVERDDSYDGTVGDLNESHTQKERPKCLSLDPKLKEIDFYSLDDVLGDDDAIYVTSKKTDNEASAEDDDTVFEHIGSETVSNYFTTFSTI